MNHFLLGAAYGVAAGMVLAVLLDLGDMAVGYVKPNLGRLNP